MYDTLAIILPFFLTGFLLPKTIKFCQQQQAIDIPNHRSSHTVPFSTWEIFLACKCCSCVWKVPASTWT